MIDEVHKVLWRFTIEAFEYIEEQFVFNSPFHR